MALTLHKDEERRLATWKDVKSYAAEKDASVRWIDCSRGTRVVGDEFIQVGGSGQFSVSMSGWASLCRKLGCDHRTLQNVHSPGLATLVINDYWAHNSDRMKSHRLVVDGSTVVGIVGQRYEPYRHGDLVDSINEFVLRHDSSEGPETLEGWNKIDNSVGIARVVGTELRVTLPLIEVEHGTTVRTGDECRSDVSWVGIEARNGLSGNCAITFRVTIHRLVCGNGLIRKAGDYGYRFSHVKRKNKLASQVHETLGSMEGSLAGTVAWLKELGGREFCSKDCVSDSESMKILAKILGALGNLGSSWKNKLRRTRDEGRRAILVEDIASDMAGYRSGSVWKSPYRNNPTWWDFINIFTECAQHCGSLSRQLRVEEQVSYLAERCLRIKQTQLPPPQL